MATAFLSHLVDANSLHEKHSTAPDEAHKCYTLEHHRRWWSANGGHWRQAEAEVEAEVEDLD